MATAAAHTIFTEKDSALLLAGFLRCADNFRAPLKYWEPEMKAIFQAFAVKYSELVPPNDDTEPDDDDTDPAGEDPKNRPNSNIELLRQFLVKSLRNAVDDLPVDAQELKEAVEALDDKHALAADTGKKKRRRTTDISDDEADERRHHFDAFPDGEVVLPRNDDQADSSSSSKHDTTTTPRRKTKRRRADVPKPVNVQILIGAKRVTLKWSSKFKVYGGGAFTVRAHKPLEGQDEDNDYFEVTTEHLATLNIEFCPAPGLGSTTSLPFPDNKN